jgi:prophage regulatory protein
LANVIETYPCINPSNLGGKLQGKANMAQKISPAAPAVITSPPGKALPVDGMSRWLQIEPFSPFSREKFRQLVNSGKAPQPIKFSERCTCYSNRELHKFFADPLNYSVEPNAGGHYSPAVATRGQV